MYHAVLSCVLLSFPKQPHTQLLCLCCQAIAECCKKLFWVLPRHTHVHTHGSVYRFPYCFSLLDVTYEQQQHHRPISLPTPTPPATTPILLSIEMHIGEQARALLTIHSPSDQGQASTPPYTRLKTLFADCRESTSGKIHLNLFFFFLFLFILLNTKTVRMETVARCNTPSFLRCPACAPPDKANRHTTIHRTYDVN